MSINAVTVQQAMTRRVHTIAPSATLLGATTILRRYNISGLPVVNAKRQVIGVISEKDISRALGGSLRPRDALEVLAHSKGRKAAIKHARNREGDMIGDIEASFRHVKVRDVMSQDPVMVSPNAPLDVAARIMQERRINRLPVVEGDRLVGILTRHDVLAAWV